ncbi:unnamed protein product [Camellia sinensis]
MMQKIPKASMVLRDGVCDLQKGLCAVTRVDDTHTMVSLHCWKFIVRGCQARDLPTRFFVSDSLHNKKRNPSSEFCGEIC